VKTESSEIPANQEQLINGERDEMLSSYETIAAAKDLIKERKEKKRKTMGLYLNNNLSCFCINYRHRPAKKKKKKRIAYLSLQ
jgi:hypothetical protein